MSRLSTSPTLFKVAYLFGATGIAFGLNAIYNPVYALSFFGFEYPSPGETKRVVDALMMIYGVRDLFMGFATLMAAYHRQSKVLGALVVATGGVALADGAVCYSVHGTGHWNHIPLAPVILGVGAGFLGVFDTV
ncbi:hypothetical protein LTS08_001668 [Lithohypha guttulata]|uniref:Uncharacterized protein n=1 Tax=Lithohypha guttulata TaxID=1690604 RepID=A0AAN7SUU7_9EURO|nr:hypothetical protein LTR51_003648 [Lithohypha guttulata]KAK5082153.1 hypothetical protein LTR05_007296 [Lithohypha guttulata]KAK5105391.1 hypothetical protein LTS08_001668 [Lithohypha guttulata]